MTMLLQTSYARAVEPVRLRCEYDAAPLGIDVALPRLSWGLASERRGTMQSAFQVLVASTSETLAQDSSDLWDSGRVVSDSNIQVSYAGVPLKSAQQVFWKVRIWDETGTASAWSEPASWTMGLLNDADWTPARWIMAAGAETSERSARGYASVDAAREEDVKWVQIDLGRPSPVTSVRLHPARLNDKSGYGFPIRYKVEASDDPTFTTQPITSADFTAKDVPNPGNRDAALNVKFPPAGPDRARFLRVTATKLWQRDKVAYAFALSQIDVMAGDQNVALGKPVTAKDGINADGWSNASVTDGFGMVEADRYPTTRLRREFSVQPRLRRAVVFVCGLGQYELTIDGAKVGDDLITPGWTNYKKTCLYDTYDVTAALGRDGRHTLGVLLGNGMYNVKNTYRYKKFTAAGGPQKVIAQLRLDYEDGSSETVPTDTQWRVTPGPITYSHVFGGEAYDARLEAAGWDKPGYDAAPWEPAVTTEGPGGKLRGYSCSAPPLRAIEALKPVTTKTFAPGTIVYDLGQNASILPRMVLKGPAGAVVKIIPAELTTPDGHADQAESGRPAYWTYTLAGSGSEHWFPKFYYRGARYLQVECSAATDGGDLPQVEALEGVVVHTSSVPAGEFSCSSALFNRIRTLVRWAQRSNLVSIITDCPHREKLGWLEEDHLNGPALRYEFQLDRLFAKLMNDMTDAQLENGMGPDIAPEYVKFDGVFRDSPEWGSALLLVAWQQYEFTGDVELLRRNYDAMKRYVDYLASRAKDDIVDHGLGDWYDIGPKNPGEAQLTPKALTATAFYYLDTVILSKAARLLDHADDAQKYEVRATQIRDAFNGKFLNAHSGTYSTRSQTANSIPLVMNLVAPEHRASVLAAIVQDVRDHGNALTAGDVGYRYLLRALAENGRSDVIFDMNNQSEKPGYGYQLKAGATSLTEAWDARRSSSQNHFMLGQIQEWFYHDLAGIQPDPSGPGFKKIVIKPALVGDLTWAKAGYQSVRGLIRSAWTRDGHHVTLDVTIPPIRPRRFTCRRSTRPRSRKTESRRITRRQ